MKTEGNAPLVRRHVLVVAMLNSIHVARWLEQFKYQPVSFTLFPSTAALQLHPRLNTLLHGQPEQVATFRVHPLSVAIPFLVRHGNSAWKLFIRGSLLRWMHGRGNYDFVHSMEFQHSGYLCLQAFRGKGLPAPLIATNWGSDIYWFRQFPGHEARIRELLRSASFYSAECHRDASLARDMGFRGTILPVIPNAGGFSNLELEMGVAAPAPSQRRTILVKGYDEFVGLAHVALDAIESCYDVLEGYRVVVYSAGPSVQERVSLMASTGAIDIEAVAPYNKSHSQMLELFRQARIYVGISKSDGISTSLLEAMASGCFPIQSGTSCADEWINHNQTGMVVQQLEASEVAACIRVALADDVLVDVAAQLNLELASQRLSKKFIESEAMKYYDLGSRM